MFNNIDEIYNHIGQTIVGALQAPWEKAYNFILFEDVDAGVMASRNNYIQSGANSDLLDFRLDITANLSLVKAYQALYKFMQQTPDDVPWNKARYTLTSDGDFDIEFKLDEDFIWLKSLNIDSQEYDDLDIKIIRQIKSWQGLPDNADRYWLKK